MRVEASQDNIGARLMPLYLSSFFQSLIFWYAIEKLFLTQIDLSSSQIGILIAFQLGTTTVLEVPSGYLSDFWSRKKTLVLAQMALLAATLIGGLANSFLDYAFAVVFYGTFWAMQSGANQAIIYDVCLVEGDSQGEQFEKYAGRRAIYTTAGLIAGALASSLITEALSVRANFFLSAIPIVIGILSLLPLVEPKLHNDKGSRTARSHTKNMFAQLLRGSELKLLVAAFVIAQLVVLILFEWSPVFWIGLGVSPSLFGVLLAALASAPAIAGYLAPKLKRFPIWAYGLPVLVLMLGLTSSNFVLVTAAVVVALTFSLTAITIVEGRINRHISSDIRTSAGSVLGLLASGISVPSFVLIGLLTQSRGIRTTGLVILAIGIVFLIVEKISTRAAQAPLT